MQSFQHEQRADGRLIALRTLINELEGLTTTSPSKYNALKNWLSETFETRPSVCYLSDHSKQWPARVGQAIMGCPTLLVLLIQGPAEPDVELKLKKLHTYVSGLDATLLFFGTEGDWSIQAAVGSSGNPLFDELSALLPDHSVRRVIETADANCPASVSGRPRAKRPDGTFFDMEPERQAEAAWNFLIGEGTLPFDEAIRLVAERLRANEVLEFERLRKDGLVYSEIQSAIAYATRRGLGFDRPRRLHVRAIKTDPDDFNRDDWRACVIRAAGTQDEWVERDVLIRFAARCAVDVFGLAMVRFRAGGRVDTALRSTVNRLIRMGVLERDGPDKLRLREGASLENRNDHSTSGGRELRPIGPVTARPVIANESEPDSIPLDPAESAAPRSGRERPSPMILRKHIGHLPHESEEVFMGLLCRELMPPHELLAATERHVQEFEDAFATQEFLDIGGALALADDSRDLLRGWDDFSLEEKHLAQAAILYFVQSDEADDDFAIDGLRTDKAVMAAVIDAVKN